MNRARTADAQRLEMLDMNTKALVLPVAAALALFASPARAQHAGHDHGSMHGAAHEGSSASHGIAEGTVKDGVKSMFMKATDYSAIK